MPITDRFGAALLTGLSPGAEDLLSFVPKRRPAGEWDEADAEWLVFDGSGGDAHTVEQRTGQEILNVGPVGSRWWMAEAPQIDQRGPGVHIVRARLKGLLEQTVPPRYGYRLNGRTDTQNADNIEIEGVVYPRVEVDEDSIELAVRWIHIGPRPDVTAVGSETTPPIAVTVRPSGWTSIPDPLYHYPNGWCLISRDPEPVCQGVDAAWLVHDLYHYRYPFSP